MLTKEWLVLTKEWFTHTKNPHDFLVYFLGYIRLNLTNLLINLLSLSRLNLGLFLCEGAVLFQYFHDGFFPAYAESHLMLTHQTSPILDLISVRLLDAAH